MSNDTRWLSLPCFHPVTVVPACFSTSHLCLRPTALATWDQLRSRGSMNCTTRTKSVAGVTLGSDRLRHLTLSGAVVLCRQWPSRQPGLADRGWLVNPRRWRGALILSIRCRLQRHHPVQTLFARESRSVLRKRDRRCYELLSKSSATSGRIGWEIMPSFER